MTAVGVPSGSVVAATGTAATASPSTFQGAGSAVGARGMVAGLLGGVVAGLMML